MLIVDNCIISEDIADRCFACDLAACHGQCCVEGDAGAPLDEDEIPVLERIYPEVKPYMTEAGRKSVEDQGVATYDNAGDPCTPLVNNRECAYVVWQEEEPSTTQPLKHSSTQALKHSSTQALKHSDTQAIKQSSNQAIAYCAIEKAFRDGKIDYQKPISCHLYPIRVDNFGEFISLNYHRWDVCNQSCQQSSEPLYKYLKEPLIRRFGQQWYDELIQQIEALSNQ